MSAGDVAFLGILLIIFGEDWVCLTGCVLLVIAALK